MMPTPLGDEPKPAALSSGAIRQIGFLPLLAIFYGYTAGGPFGYEEIFQGSGPGMALVFLTFVPFFWSIPMSFASAELNSILPVQGGFYRWSRAAFGDFWGFQCGWWNWTGTFLLNSLYGVLVMDYLGDYIPGLTGYWKWAGASLVLIILAYLNYRGIQIAGWLSVALLVAVFIPVAWLCLVAVFQWHYSPVLPVVPPGKSFGSVFGKGLALAMWNYAGYEQLSSVTGEMKDPQKTFVRVLAWNTPMNILTYTLPATLALAVLGNWKEWNTGYMVTASRQIGGEALGAAMLLASIIATASLSNSTILYTTRIPAAMAEDGYLPRRLAGVDRRGVPAGAVLVSAALYSLFCLLGFGKLIVLDALLYTLSLVLEFLALWRLRRREPELPRPFRIPGGSLGLVLVVVPPLGVAAALLGFTFWHGLAHPAWLALSLVMAVAGVPLFWLLKSNEANRTSST